MSIQQYIRDQVFTPRLKKSQAMVVYDPEQRYRDICISMVDDHCLVVDATETSIDSRAAAIGGLKRLGSGDLHQLLVYVPKARPLEDEDRQKDPFALYAVCGTVFPSGDGDAYQSLCLKAKPDHAKQIRDVFEGDEDPGFAVIDAIGGGLGWPNLRALLSVESAGDILFALLVPNDTQQAALKHSDSWATEARELLGVCLGLKLKTKGKTWSSISDELWRYLLFSEFVFDLPDSLPSQLEEVPHAGLTARAVVEDLADRLRNDRRTQAIYIERAESVESELELADNCSHIFDLGDRDTFPFEERTFLRHATKAMAENNTDLVRNILSRHARSVWTGKGESQAQWDLLSSAAALVETCEDHERLLSSHSSSLDSLIDFYVSQLREVDRLHREFEQSVSDYDWQDVHGVMEPVKHQARQHYGQLIEKIQVLFTKHFADTGWPLTGRLSNTEVFDKLVAPKLQQSGKKIAYFMVDALRYELGVALEKQLAEDGEVVLRPALAQMPSVTPVGMASLLPGAAAGLRLEKGESGFIPFIDDQQFTTVKHRMDWISKRYGQRLQEGRLEDFVKNRFKLDKDAELLVLRSVEIDSHFENNPDSAPAEIINALKRIRVAINKLKVAGFDEVVIATDHGFFMNTHAGAGDTCSKPPGTWRIVHERCLLGDGSTDGNHYCISAEKAGIRTDYGQLAGPLSMASYRSGLLYYHGGASLQELIVPVITVGLERTRLEGVTTHANVEITYKNGAKYITTRLPVVELKAEAQDQLFGGQNDIGVLIEAHDSKNNVVGEAKPGGNVNPATGTLSLKPGDTVQVTLKMQMEFEGNFKVKVLNPSTMATYASLDLATDYTV